MACKGFDLHFWNPNKVGKPYAQVLVRDLEFEDEQHSRRLILYPARRTTDKGMTYFRDFHIKQDFRGRYNTWWSNFFQAHCHKEGVFFTKQAQIKMFKYRIWQGNRAEPKISQLGQIIEWGRGVLGMDRNGKPKEIPTYYAFQFTPKLRTKCVTGVNWYQTSVISI